jgi:ketosteroid isomerase-like protein
MSAKHKAIVEEVNDAMRRGDTESFLARCTDDFVWAIVGEPAVHGKEAVRQYMGQGPQEPPVFTVDTLVGDGDVVVAKGAMTMTNDAGSGVDNDYAFCDVWQFRGDQLASLNAFVIKTSRAPKAATAGAGR